MARIGPTIPQPMTTISHLSISTPFSYRMHVFAARHVCRGLGSRGEGPAVPSPQHAAAPRGFEKLLLVRAGEFIEKRIQERIHACRSHQAGRWDRLIWFQLDLGITKDICRGGGSVPVRGRVRPPTKRRKVTVLVRARVLGWLIEAMPRGLHRRLSIED